MKKGIIVLVIMLSVLALTGCGKKEPIKTELTSENFESYFTIEAQVTDFRTETKKTIWSTDYIGYANLKVKVKPKKDVTTEDIKIKGRVTYTGLCWAGRTDYFEVTLDKNGEADYSGAVTTNNCPIWQPDMPHITGFYDYTLKDGEFLANEKHILITSISGSVYEEQ